MCDDVKQIILLNFCSNVNDSSDTNIYQNLLYDLL